VKRAVNGCPRTMLGLAMHSFPVSCAGRQAAVRAALVYAGIRVIDGVVRA
jgi:hypothetical protein